MVKVTEIIPIYQLNLPLHPSLHVFFLDFTVAILLIPCTICYMTKALKIHIGLKFSCNSLNDFNHIELQQNNLKQYINLELIFINCNTNFHCAGDYTHTFIMPSMITGSLTHNIIKCVRSQVVMMSYLHRVTRHVLRPMLSWTPAHDRPLSLVWIPGVHHHTLSVHSGSRWSWVSLELLFKERGTSI